MELTLEVKYLALMTGIKEALQLRNMVEEVFGLRAKYISNNMKKNCNLYYNDYMHHFKGVSFLTFFLV